MRTNRDLKHGRVDVRADVRTNRDLKTRPGGHTRRLLGVPGAARRGRGPAWVSPRRQGQGVGRVPFLLAHTRLPARMVTTKDRLVNHAAASNLLLVVVLPGLCVVRFACGKTTRSTIIIIIIKEWVDAAVIHDLSGGTTLEPARARMVSPPSYAVFAAPRPRTAACGGCF